MGKAWHEKCLVMSLSIRRSITNYRAQRARPREGTIAARTGRMGVRIFPIAQESRQTMRRRSSRRLREMRRQLYVALPLMALVIGAMVLGLSLVK